MENIINTGTLKFKITQENIRITESGPGILGARKTLFQGTAAELQYILEHAEYHKVLENSEYRNPVAKITP